MKKYEEVMKDEEKKEQLIQLGFYSEKQQSYFKSIKSLDYGVEE